jgi:8-oxo-dGTP diphosphatase
MAKPNKYDSEVETSAQFPVEQAPIRVTVDIVVFTVHDQALRVLLVERGIEPFLGLFALPGGFVLAGETLEQAAFRELREETGTAEVYLEQLYTFGDPGRDPRGRVVTVAYYALVPSGRSPLLAGTDAASAAWFTVAELPKLAFDHAGILDYAVNRLRGKLEYSNVGYELLPEKFTLTALQVLHEAILGRKLDKRNFRRKVLGMGLLKPLKEKLATGRKPAELYSFRDQR